MDLRLQLDNSRKETNIFNNLPLYLLCPCVSLLPRFSRGSNILLSYTVWIALAFILKKPIRQTVRTTGMEFQCVAISHHKTLPVCELKQSGQLTTACFFSLCSLVPYAYCKRSYFIYLPNIPCKISSSQGNSLIISHEGNGMWRKNASLHLSFSSSTTCKNTRAFQIIARQQSSIYFSFLNNLITSVMTLLKRTKKIIYIWQNFR